MSCAFLHKPWSTCIFYVFLAKVRSRSSAVTLERRELYLIGKRVLLASSVSRAPRTRGAPARFLVPLTTFSDAKSLCLGDMTPAETTRLHNLPEAHAIVIIVMMMISNGIPCETGRLHQACLI